MRKAYLVLSLLSLMVVSIFSIGGRQGLLYGLAVACLIYAAGFFITQLRKVKSGAINLNTELSAEFNPSLGESETQDDFESSSILSNIFSAMAKIPEKLGLSGTGLDLRFLEAESSQELEQPQFDDRVSTQESQRQEGDMPEEAQGQKMDSSARLLMRSGLLNEMVVVTTLGQLWDKGWVPRYVPFTKVE